MQDPKFVVCGTGDVSGRPGLRGVNRPDQPELVLPSEMSTPKNIGAAGRANHLDTGQPSWLGSKSIEKHGTRVEKLAFVAGEVPSVGRYNTYLQSVP